MHLYTREDIIRMVEEEDVEFIRLQFTDIFGNLKNMAITASQLEKALDNRCMFDGSAIDGFVRIEESDMYLYPDYNTFEILPFRPQQGKVARLICDVYRPNGKPFEGDPRQVLRTAIEYAAKVGFTMEVSPECEFYLFDTDDLSNATNTTKEEAGFFDIGPLDFGENARRDIVMNLEDMGFVVEASHHEHSPAQHEIDFAGDEALATADNLQTFRLTVRTIAKRHGLHASFMPKPKDGVSGSGMHLNLRLKKDGVNIFGSDTDPMGLSKEAYYFIGGLMKHIKGMTAILNPLVNSYKRLVNGCDASAYIAWSATNRSPMIRIPNVAKGEEARIELRSPDPTANPYLSLAVILMAGMDGIEHQIMPPKAVTGNVFHMTEEERKAAGIDILPMTLMDALDELEKDKFLCDILGDHIKTYYTAKKKEEHESYFKAVTDWEVREYLRKY